MNTPWLSPIPLSLVATRDSSSFREMPQGTTGLPRAPHPGAFGVQRRHHVHEGVDLYVPEGTPVHAVEAGRVVRIEWFTGPKADTPWWLDTQAIFVEGASGVVVYGEITVLDHLKEGSSVQPGDLLGHVAVVLRQDKGRPTAMLHMELHAHGARSAPAWEGARPETLLDPTPFLLPLCR